jgi:hypothetical protein
VLLVAELHIAKNIKHPRGPCDLCIPALKSHFYKKSMLIYAAKMVLRGQFPHTTFVA